LARQFVCVVSRRRFRRQRACHDDNCSCHDHHGSRNHHDAPTYDYDRAHDEHDGRPHHQYYPRLDNHNLGWDDHHWLDHLHDRPAGHYHNPPYDDHDPPYDDHDPPYDDHDPPDDDHDPPHDDHDPSYDNHGPDDHHPGPAKYDDGAYHDGSGAPARQGAYPHSPACHSPARPRAARHGPSAHGPSAHSPLGHRPTKRHPARDRANDNDGSLDHHGPLARHVTSRQHGSTRHRISGFPSRRDNDHDTPCEGCPRDAADSDDGGAHDRAGAGIATGGSPAHGFADEARGGRASRGRPRARRVGGA
jgi:hypothetical protein